jgi:hypothetical protein
VILISKILELQRKYPHIYIGGSIALILQGAIPARTPGDIDIISPEKIKLNQILDINTPARRCYFEGERYELFVNYDAKFVEFPIENEILKLSPIEEVIEWKRKRNHSKHNNDLKYLLI